MDGKHSLNVKELFAQLFTQFSIIIRFSKTPNKNGHFTGILSKGNKNVITKNRNKLKTTYHYRSWLLND